MNTEMTFLKKHKSIKALDYSSPPYTTNQVQKSNQIQILHPKIVHLSDFKNSDEKVGVLQIKQMKQQTSIGTRQCHRSRELQIQDKQNLLEHQHFCRCQCQSKLLALEGNYQCYCAKKGSVSQTVLNFIDSQSSGQLQLSFMSDFIQKSQKGEKNEIRATFKYHSSLTVHEMKVFQREKNFKPQFVKVVSQWIYNIFAKKVNAFELRQKQDQKFQLFFNDLKKLNINHPFVQNINQLSNNKGLQTFASKIDKWIFQYAKFQKIIFSFDFMFSHITFIILMIFYWLKLQSSNEYNPLISNQQIVYIEKNKIKAHEIILLIIKSYICNRSRQMVNNPIVQKIILKFYEYIIKKFFLTQDNKKFQNIKYACHSLIQQFNFVIQRQIYLKQTFNIGKHYNKAHLFQIWKKYQKEDKFIQDDLSQQVHLFCEIDKRNFVQTPINRYFQTGSQTNTNDFLAQKHSLLSCWILKIILKRYKQVSFTVAVKYCVRVYELTKKFFQHKNFQRCVFFLCILYNLKMILKNLWQKFIKKMMNEQKYVETQIRKIKQQVQKLLFLRPNPIKNNSRNNLQNNKQEIIYEEGWIHQIINGIKCRFPQRDMVNLNFHQDIQQFAKKISLHRKILQNQLLRKQQNTQNINKTIKFNLNFRFLNNYVYEQLKKQNTNQIQMFNKWKQQATQYEQNYGKMILYSIIRRFM